MLLPITLTLAAACAFLTFWLGVRCSKIRVKAQILHGDGGDALLGKRMRAHANFSEYAPIVLILTALVELAVGSSIWLWIAALAFVIGRIAHAFGMDSDKPGALRAGGILLTMLVMLGLAVAALVTAYQASREVPAPPAMAQV
jgi:uncharacterized membrane protein YecN with MAPEG domain